MPGGAALTGPTVIMRSDALTHREREPKPRRPGKAKPPPGFLLCRRHRRHHAARHRLLYLLLIHIHRAQLPIHRWLQRGIRLHAAAGGELNIAVTCNRQRRPAPLLQHAERNAAPVEAHRGLPQRQLGNGRRGFQNTFLGKCAQVGNVHRRGVSIQRQRRTAHVHAVKGRRRAVQGCAAAPDAPLASCRFAP